MPQWNQMFEGLGNAAKTAASFLTGPPQEKAANPLAADARRAGAHAVIDDDIEDVVESAGRPGKKRHHPSDRAAMDASKRRKRTAQDDVRLEPVYDVPRDAVTIQVPRYSDSPSENDYVARKSSPTLATKMPSKMGGGHRPMNTLGRPGIGAATGPSSFERRAPRNGIQATQSQSRRQAPAARETPTNGIGDAFPDSERTTKRRKTVVQTNPRDPIDLDSDESKPTSVKEVVGVNVRRPSQTSQQSHISIEDSQSQPPPSQPFKPSESKYVFDQLNLHQKKKRRLQNPESNRGSIHTSPSQRSRTRDGTMAQPVDLDGDNLEKPRSSKKLKAEPTAEPGRLKIDLGKDVRKYVDETLQQHDVEDINEAMRKGPRPSYATGRKTPHPGSRYQPMRDTATPPNIRNNLKREQGNSITQQQQQQQQRPKRVNGMQVESRRQSVQSNNQSNLDELAGSPSHDLRQNAPLQRNVNATSIRTLAASRPRHPPTHALEDKPQPGTSTGNGNLSSISAPSLDPPETVRIPIAAIYSRGCLLNDFDIELVWNAEDKHFLVYYRGQPQTVPGRPKFMHIGRGEVHDWISCSESPLVQIKGSTTSFSMNMILLRFREAGDKHECQDQLMHAFNDNIRFPGGRSAERLDQIFRTQVVGIQEDYRKQAERAKEDALEAPRRQNDGSLTRNTSPEGIKNEDDMDNVSRRGSARFRMQDRAGVETSPYFEQQATRKSTRQPKPIKPKSRSPTPPERWTQVNKPTPWNQSVLFPQSGARRITVDFQDLERLDEQEFLNDNVVGFALRRTEEAMPAVHRQKVHFFNSFFYSSLSTKNGKKGFNYDAVKKWTKAQDIFNHQYVVVPINENLHWYLAIICNLPNLMRQTVLVEDDADEEPPPPRSPPSPNTAPLSRSSVVPNSQEDSKPPPAEVPGLDTLSLSDEDPGPTKDHSVVFNFGDDGKVALDDAESNGEAKPEEGKRSAGASKRKKKAPPPLKKVDPNQPVIITMDSFGSAHTGEVARLKDYIRAEGEEKRGMTVTRDQISGVTAKGIPEQTNFCDCGLYLVGYVQEFAKDPDKFVKKVLSRELDKNSDFADFDPSKKRDELRDDLLILYKEQDEAKKEEKRRKKAEREAAVARSAGLPEVWGRVPAQSAATSKRPSPESSSKAPSPEKQTRPKALWAPVESSQTAGSSAAADESSRPPSVPRASAKDDEDEPLEAEPARPLVEHQRLKPAKRAAKSSASTSSPPPNQPEADEMLDNHASPDEAAQYEAVSPPHKTDGRLFDKPFDAFAQAELPVANHSRTSAPLRAGQRP